MAQDLIASGADLPAVMRATRWRSPTCQPGMRSACWPGAARWRGSREAQQPVTAEDPDAIGPDGTVRLRCYLPSAGTLWFSAECCGCDRVAPISVAAAVRLMGSGEATVRQLAGRLRCGKRQVSILVQPDTRSAATWEREGPAPETLADPTRPDLP